MKSLLGDAFVQIRIFLLLQTNRLHLSRDSACVIRVHRRVNKVFIVTRIRSEDCWFFDQLYGKRLVHLYLVGPVAQSVQRLSYRAGRSRIEFRCGRDFPSVQTGPGAHPASCKMGTESFPGVKCGRGVLLTTHSFLVPRSWNSRAISLTTLWATPGL